MKKLIALLMALVLVLSFAACAGKNESAEETVEETTEETEEKEVISVEDLTEDMNLEDFLSGEYEIEFPLIDQDGNIIDPETGEPLSTTDTLTVLQNIWNAYGDEEKFAIMGGNPEAGIMDAPGSYDMAYAENLGFQLVIPAEQMSNVTEAATMIHMMNANNFSCGAIKLAEGVDEAAFAQAVRDALQGNQWICGFPETMVIARAGGVLVIAFGVNDAMTPFMDNMTAVYSDAQILFNEAIAG